MSDETTSPSPNSDDPANERRVREILDRVAAGELSAEEAAGLLAQKPAEPRHAAPSSDVWEAVADPITKQSTPGTEPATPAEHADSDESAGDHEDSAESGGESHGRPTVVPSEEGAAEFTHSGDSGEAVDEREEMHADVPVPAGVQRVVVRAIGRRVRLVGEPAVTGVAVDGPHAIKREGDTLSINSDGEMGVSIDGLSMLRTRSVGDLKSNVVGGLAKELSIRVNPRIAVEVEVTAGTFSAERAPALSKVRVTAGSAKVSDVTGPIDLLVQAGSATLDAQLTKGKSRVRVESGSATVKLRRGSDVRVHSEAQLGRVTWTGAVNGPSRDVEIGRGRASLDVEVLIGTAQIASD
jgi:hypothetical protein